MVLIQTANQPIVFSGPEVIYDSSVPTPQAAAKIIIRSDINTPVTYNGQEVIQ